MNKRILIGCPVRNRELYLPHYLKHIYNIYYDKKLIDICWVVNNSTDNSLELLREFKKKYKDEYNSITIDIYNNKNFRSCPKDERTSDIRDKIYHWLSELRNRLLNKCKKLNCDYLLSCDSDILVPSDILNRLLYHNKDIIASLIYNGYLHTPRYAEKDYDSIINAYKFPNILNNESYNYQHKVNYKVKNPNLNQINELLEVDFTGAVYIISKDVCEKAKYGYHIQGEDEAFCKSAKQYGFKLYCDVSLYSQHCMSEKILNMYLNGELKYANGDTILIK